MGVNVNMTKFNEEACSIILDARASGMNKKECAGLAGITERTLDRWLKRGEKAKSGKYRDFYFAYLKANLEFTKYHRDKIAEHNDWHASQYLLQVNEHGKYNLAHQVESKVDASVKSEATVNLLNKIKEKRGELDELNRD